MTASGVTDEPPERAADEEPTDAVPAAAGAPRHRVTSFIGRGELLAYLLSVLQGPDRLVTLKGPGGVGKTSLMEQVATRLISEGQRDHGVVVVYLGDLKSDDDDQQVAATIASALGLRDNVPTPALSRLVQYLRNRRKLIMLDNAEHLLGDGVDGPVQRVLRTLLMVSEGLRLLVTSRNQLGVLGERVVNVPGMDVGLRSSAPGPGDDQVHEAVQVLIERAAAVEKVIDPGQYDLASWLCEQLGGNPLMIELAAGRLVSTTLEDIVDKPPLKVLVDGGSDQKRHRSLRGTMDWTYRLLKPAEQQMWLVLSVFEGGLDVAAAEAVCGRMGIEEAAVEDLLRGLVLASLLSAEPVSVLVDGRYRQRMRYRLQTGVREYGLDLVAAAGLDHQLRTAHAEYVEALVARGAAEWLTAEEIEWMVPRLGHNELNILAAQWFRLTDEDPELVGRGADMAIDAARSRFLIFGGKLKVQVRMLASAIAKLGPEPTVRLVALLAFAAWVAMIQGLREEARRLLDQAEAAAEALGLGDTFFPLEHARNTWKWLCVTDPPDVETMYALLLRTEKLARASGASPGDNAMIELFTGIWAAFLADAGIARAVAARVLATGRATKAPWHTAWGLFVSALAQLRNRRPDEAMALAQEARQITDRIHDLWAFAWIGLLLARILSEMGEHFLACQMLGGSNAVRDLNNARIEGLYPFLQLQREVIAAATRELGAEQVNIQITIGESRPLDDIRAFATQVGTLPEAGQPGTRPGTLTDREFEVAGLVAAGRTNKEIAARLVISLRTVEKHIENTMRKLNVATRTQIASWYPGQGANLTHRES